MNLLVVGSLSWNPERLRSLHERGHRLWGLWSRSMAWDQGPYPALEGCVTPVAPVEAARAIREHAIDCVYSLFQIYHPRLWGPDTPGVERDVWTLLRSLVAERQRGTFDVPIVRHWGFDVQNLAPDVVRALDAHIFCNREKAAYWTTPVRAGGCGVDMVADCPVVSFLDSDRPKQEFMNDDFAEPLSVRVGEVHTVCIGRPFGINYIANARRGIHVHLYGNNYDDIWRLIARDLPLSGVRKYAALLRHFVHVHPSLQTSGADWDDIRRAKSSWVREFSRYDAGWSYVGSPLPWEPLDDRGAIPNRVSTYMLAGLPVISDIRRGYYRYDELTRLGINIDLTGSDALRERLDHEIRTREGRRNAVRERAGYSFDATIDTLIATLDRARVAYFARPHHERIRSRKGRRRLIHFNTSPDIRALAFGFIRRVARPPRISNGAAERRPGSLLEAIRAEWRRPVVAVKTRLLTRSLKPALEALVASASARAAVPGTRAATRLTIAMLERFTDTSRRCESPAIAASDTKIVWNLPAPLHDPAMFLREMPGALVDWVTVPASTRERSRLLRACFDTRGARLGALLRAPRLLRHVRAREVDAIACFSAKDFALAHLLAEETGSPYRETLAQGTQYFGEFAFELLAVIPYAYWLASEGRLASTVSVPDTRCLYWFSPQHEERSVPRRYVPITEYPLGVAGTLRYDRKAFPAALDTSRWLPPPYSSVYRDDRFRWAKPTCVVGNKTTDEHYLWHRAPTNFMPNDLMLKLIGALRTRYQVVYNRPRAVDIVNDHQTIRETGDIEAVTRAYPDVLTIQALHAMHPDLGYNELQLRLYSGCKSFVSVLGGGAYLASYFGGTNVVYAKRGWEVACGAYERWFDRFSGARVVAAASPEELLRAVERELL
jgi:hypothetical protein